MTTQLVGLDTLHTLGGGILKEVFDKLLKEAADDCEDRPHVKKARSVNIKGFLVPNLGSDGRCDGYTLAFDIDCSVPKRESTRFDVKRGQHGIYHNEVNPDDLPGQTTILEHVGTGTDG